MSKRVLVLSASVGAGHLRAAQAVELASAQLDPQAVVKNVDVLELTNAAFRRVYGKAYLDLVNKAPHVLGLFLRPAGPPAVRRSGRRTGCGSPSEKLNLRPFHAIPQEGAVGPGRQHAFSAGRDHRRAAKAREAGDCRK